MGGNQSGIPSKTGVPGVDASHTTVTSPIIVALTPHPVNTPPTISSNTYNHETKDNIPSEGKKQNGKKKNKLQRADFNDGLQDKECTNEESIKIKYEQDIKMAFGNPHISHLDRLSHEKVMLEKTDLPDINIEYTEVQWLEAQLTYDIGKSGMAIRTMRRCNRSKTDPWRRYGAMRKLHEMGGIGCVTTVSNNGKPPVTKYYKVEAGSEPPSPPKSVPISTIDDYGPFEYNPPIGRKQDRNADCG